MASGIASPCFQRTWPILQIAKTFPKQMSFSKDARNSGAKAGSSTAATQMHVVDSDHWANSETTAWEMLHSSISKPASITFFPFEDH